MKKMKSIVTAIVMISFITVGAAYGTEWVEISGKVLDDNGIHICGGMVLANGSYNWMYETCYEGKYGLNVPLDQNGTITIFCLCDGFLPFKAVLNPDSAAVNFDINMVRPLPDMPELTLTAEVTLLNYNCLTPPFTAECVKISGKVSYNDTPICAAVLVTQEIDYFGRFMFSCDGEGKYNLN